MRICVIKNSILQQVQQPGRQVKRTALRKRTGDAIDPKNFKIIHKICHIGVVGFIAFKANGQNGF